MEKFIKAAGIPIRIAVWDSGHSRRQAVILLHGYLETLDIWSGIAKELGRQVCTLALDLPGHGLSGSHPVNTMELMADAVADACEELGIAQALLVGHSMGGYAALAFARKYPQCTAGLCLLHSTPNADSPEKRVARAAEIDLIASGKRDKVIRDALPKLFAPQNLKRMQPRIDELACALQVSNEGIIACIKGMQERSDMNDFLKEFAKPLLLVFGRGDMYIAAETAQTMIDKFPQAQTVWMENSGHCGFLEEPEKALQTLLEFAGKVFG